MEKSFYTGKGIGVCILDTGIYEHIDFTGRIWTFYDFLDFKRRPYDDNGHGTHVAGLVAGDGTASMGKYRGAAPIQQSVLNGDKVTGVTAMQMAEGLDTGDILTVIETKIGENETSGELFDRLSILGGELIIKTLEMLENGEIKPVKQDESKATHTSKIDKSFCPIDFTKSADEVHNKVRGLNPWPIATAELNGKKLKIYSTKVCEKSGKAGTIISIKPLIVACGSGSVEIIELQPEGKKRMPSAAFLAGHKLNIGDSFN